MFTYWPKEDKEKPEKKPPKICFYKVETKETAYQIDKAHVFVEYTEGGKVMFITSPEGPNEEEAMTRKKSIKVITYGAIISGDDGEGETYHLPSDDKIDQLEKDNAYKVIEAIRHADGSRVTIINHGLGSFTYLLNAETEYKGNLKLDDTVHVPFTGRLGFK